MARPSTCRSTVLLVLIALAPVGQHGFVAAPCSALRVRSYLRPSGTVKTRVPRKARVKLKRLGHWSRDFLLPQAGANQHWPYGLLDDENFEFYARKLDGDFFADVKNSSVFLQALEQDASEKPWGQMPI